MMANWMNNFARKGSVRWGDVLEEPIKGPFVEKTFVSQHKGEQFLMLNKFSVSSLP